MKELSLEELEIHELAHITPTMTEEQYRALKDSLEEHGQQMPVITYRGKVIDGRHRCKALRELGVPTVLTDSIASQLSAEDIKEKILNVYENRRHQTPTQKAIIAYRYYMQSRESGDKLGQGVVAKRFGTTVKQIGRVKTLHKLAGDDIVEILFQGNKLNTGTVTQPSNTDSLATLVLFFKKNKEHLIEVSSQTTINEDFTDEEIELTNSVVNGLVSVHSHRVAERISQMLYHRIKEAKVVDGSI